MKKIFLLLLVTLLIVPMTEIKAEDESNGVCQLILDEDGQILNEQEYLACMEEHGYGIEPLENKWGKPNGE